MKRLLPTHPHPPFVPPQNYSSFLFVVLQFCVVNSSLIICKHLPESWNRLKGSGLLRLILRQHHHHHPHHRDACANTTTTCVHEGAFLKLEEEEEEKSVSSFASFGKVEEIAIASSVNLIKMKTISLAEVSLRLKLDRKRTTTTK